MPRSYLPFYPPVAVNALTAAKDNRVLTARGTVGSEGELQKHPYDEPVSLARRVPATAKTGTGFKLCRSIGTLGVSHPRTNDVCFPLREAVDFDVLCVLVYPRGTV